MIVFRDTTNSKRALTLAAAMGMALTAGAALADDQGANVCRGDGCLPGMSAKECPGAKSISPAEAKTLFQANLPALKAGGKSTEMVNLFIDTRTPALYAKGHIPGAVNMSVPDKAFTKEALTAATGGAAKPIVIYCNGEYCPNSFVACQMAQGWGYGGPIHYFWTGMGANGWGSVNGPVVQGDKPVP